MLRKVKKYTNIVKIEGYNASFNLEYFSILNNKLLVIHLGVRGGYFKTSIYLRTCIYIW